MEPNPAAVAWGAEIKRRRDELNLTRRDVAETVGVSTTMVGYWETGKHAPLPTMQARLVAYLGLDVTAIYAAMTGETPA